MKMQAVLESGATKYVKNAGTVVVLKLQAPAHSALFEILRKATGGVVEIEIEAIQETIPLGVSDEPNDSAERNPFARNSS